MQNFDLQKYLRKNPLLEDKNSNSEDFLSLLVKVQLEDSKILNEGLLDKIKEKIKSLFTSTNQDEKFINHLDKEIEKNSVNKEQFLKDLKKLFSSEDFEVDEFTKTLNSEEEPAILQKSSLKEDYPFIEGGKDYGEISTEKEYKDLENKLKPGDSFTWVGEDNPLTTFQDSFIINTVSKMSGTTPEQKDGLVKKKIISSIIPSYIEDKTISVKPNLEAAFNFSPAPFILALALVSNLNPVAFDIFFKKVSGFFLIFKIRLANFFNSASATGRFFILLRSEIKSVSI